jgi:hypothetical protein
MDMHLLIDPLPSLLRPERQKTDSRYRLRDAGAADLSPSISARFD